LGEEEAPPPYVEVADPHKLLNDTGVPAFNRALQKMKHELAVGVGNYCVLKEIKVTVMKWYSHAIMRMWCLRFLSMA